MTLSDNKKSDKIYTKAPLSLNDIDFVSKEKKASKPSRSIIITKAVKKQLYSTENSIERELFTDLDNTKPNLIKNEKRIHQKLVRIDSILKSQATNLESEEEVSEEKIVHILDEVEEVEEDFNFDIEDEISALNTSETNQIDINSFEDDSKEEIERFDDDYEAESSSIEWSLFDEKEKNNNSDIESKESELEENEIDDIIDNEDSYNNESDENHLFESVIEIESKMNSSEIDTTTIEAVDKSQKDELQDPFNSSVSDFQKQRSAERRLRMKEFNYKFNKSKIDDIENEPAYKRRGIELEDKNYSEENEISRTSITLDENDDMKIRKNNSFLHDNVD